MSLLLCIYVGASPRQAAKTVEVVAFMFNGLLGGAPCHTTIRTWLAKMGIDTMKHKNIDITQAYALILDASISVNDQQLLLALKVPADHTGKALTHADEEVVGMAISNNWPAEKVRDFCNEIASEQKHEPEYCITDNGKNLMKAMELSELPHHKDISHTFAMYLKWVYEKDDDFVNFKNLVGNTKHLALTRFAYLMPPKQRSMARFMNMYPIIDWAKKILLNYHRMTKDEKYYFSFVYRNAGLVEELDEVLSTYADIMEICKQEGFSLKTIGKCKDAMRKRLLDGNERMRCLKDSMNEYFDTESKLLTTKHPVHNISSDIIESDFGLFKDRMPMNRTNGFTESILFVPLKSRFHNIDNIKRIDISIAMERTTMLDVKHWKMCSLKPNPMVKRRNILSA